MRKGDENNEPSTQNKTEIKLSFSYKLLVFCWNHFLLVQELFQLCPLRELSDFIYVLDVPDSFLKERNYIFEISVDLLEGIFGFVFLCSI